MPSDLIDLDYVPPTSTNDPIDNNNANGNECSMALLPVTTKNNPIGNDNANGNESSMALLPVTSTNDSIGKRDQFQWTPTY